jgi:hypothetical protein
MFFDAPESMISGLRYATKAELVGASLESI